MKVNEEKKCHICEKVFKYNAIGRHYKYMHNIILSQNDDEYIKYINYNYPNFIEKIIDECNVEKKSVNILLKEKYFEIGEGLINTLQKLLKNKINVTKEDINKIKKNKRDNTCIAKYGKIYSDEYEKHISGFKKNIKLAKKASAKAKLNIKNIEHNKTYFNTEEFKRKRKETLLKKYGTIIPRQKCTSKWHLEIKRLLEYNNIITEKEINIVGNYITDEFDRINNVCIEFNGDFWHCNPNIFNENYYHPIIKMTAKEIWEKDRKKYEMYRKNGYNVFIIWESDNLKKKINEYKRKYRSK